ncbi:MAG TPA: NAD(P)/FAD-dependent oxidoreductase [Candidatus Lokiarchaeia archaeon]|nr:NAD(P)/FAD-dependent oxidoreductase [Candidatus Lokiarchaeia archaeon]
MDAQVIIVGAGPVGLLLGNLLGKKNIDTLILETKLEGRPGSRAIGISPPSLEILHRLDLDTQFIQKGIKGKIASFHDENIRLASVRIKKLPTRYSFVLAMSQSITESILEERLQTCGHVKFLRGHEVVDVVETTDGVTITARDVNQTSTRTFTARFACACDGERSVVRKKLGIPFVGSFYKPTFVMGDYKDRSGYGDDAHLWFTADGSVEAFPIADGKRRWIIQTRSYMMDVPVGILERVVFYRTRFPLDIKDKTWESSFGVQHFMAETYHHGMVFLCGDAAHTMSPIGGQGMNTGFADAEFLAFILSHALQDSSLDINTLGYYYEHYRKIAARVATIRADLGMRLGTGRGRLFSAIRGFALITSLHSPLVQQLTMAFAMLTIPYNTLSKVLVKIDILDKARKSTMNKMKK